MVLLCNSSKVELHLKKQSWRGKKKKRQALASRHRQADQLPGPHHFSVPWFPRL